MRTSNKFTIIMILVVITIVHTSCDEFVNIDPPRTALVRETVFQDDATANATMAEVYHQLKQTGFASGTIFSFSLYLSWSSDEQLNYYIGDPTTVAQYNQFNNNDLKSDNTFIASSWLDLYANVYKCNAILEGLAASSKISDAMKKQLEGEARFVRAFCYFYLVNLWGDVPLALSTDYRINASLPRTPQTEVYQQIIEDLQIAKELLPRDYSFAKGERIRASAWAATAMLARVYLYSEDWENAELQATEIINHTALFATQTNISAVYNINNTEAILQWWSNIRPNDRGTFYFTSYPDYGAIRQEFMNAFEPGDTRSTTWASLSTLGYYRTLKYNTLIDNPPAQYSTVLRLAEQYLIRAEARARLNKISLAQQDVNILRSRAGLSATTASDTQSLVDAILQERRSEFFNEWGHRWLDLKRTGRAENVLSPLKPGFTATDLLFPLPESELVNNPALSGHQNPGY